MAHHESFVDLLIFSCAVAVVTRLLSESQCESLEIITPVAQALRPALPPKRPGRNYDAEGRGGGDEQHTHGPPLNPSHFYLFTHGASPPIKRPDEKQPGIAKLIRAV